jgi:hypothetical protein
MPTLHLGVIDLPYGYSPPKAKKNSKSRLKASTVLTTGDVAEILEAKYHPFEIFWQLKQKKIVKELENGLAGQLESILMGAPLTVQPFDGACSKIEGMFKDFLTNREMERLGFPGVPTQAALDGVNKRLLHPYSKDNPRRPSFINTGQYQASAKAWVD